MAELVYQVDKVTLVPTGSPPVHIEIKAEGMVSTSGWTNPQLILVDAKPDKDGNLYYDFKATPPDPDDVSLQVLTPIKTSVFLYDLTGVKAIVVKSVTNEKTAYLK